MKNLLIHLAIWHHSAAISSELKHPLLEDGGKLIKGNDKVQNTRKFTRLTRPSLDCKIGKHLTGGLSPTELTSHWARSSRDACAFPKLSFTLEWAFDDVAAFESPSLL